VLLRFLVASAILIAYSVVVIFAGHGAGPVALLMIFGSSTAWLSSQILGWPGVLVSLAALCARSEATYLSMRFWGALLLVLSVCAFLSRSEVIVFSALTALPLLGTWLYFLWRHVASSRARPSAATPGRPRQVTLAVVGLGITLIVQAASLVPTFAQDSMAPLEVFAVLQCLALSVCAVQTWRGANWARWSLIALVVASWLLFAQGSLGALRRLSVDAMITGTLLLLDVAILGLLLTRPASSWLRGRQAHIGHGP
jgi:hypothetical protein